MDTKSKNINREEENKLDIKKEKSNSKRTFKKNSNKKYIIYILTVIVLVTAILSGLEVKDNLGYVIPDKIYTQTEVADNISYYTSLVEKYSLYYKSSTYTKNKDNITKNDIEICKSELQDKANAEYEDYRNSKYNDDSFNNLTYEQQEKILNEEQEKINEKYTLSDEEMNEYILNRKSNSASDLNNKIKSYVNLNFRSYDKLNDLWIGGNEIGPSKVRATSRYFKEIKIDYNGNISKYNTGRVGLFSQTLLDKAVEEEKAREERKKIDADNILIAEIEKQLNDLRNYIIKDVDAVSYLYNRYSKINNSILKVYQDEKKTELSNELNNIQLYFEKDICRIEKYEERENIINAAKLNIELKNNIVSDLNSFNSFVVIDRDSINKVESMYNNIKSSINKLDNNKDIDYYMGKLEEIKGYKEILLKPYREEIRKELEAKQNTLKIEIQEKLDKLGSISDYFEGVENDFIEIESLLNQAKEIDIDISSYQSRYLEIKEYLLSLKPIIEDSIIEDPIIEDPIIEDSIVEESAENVDKPDENVSEDSNISN